MALPTEQTAALSTPPGKPVRRRFRQRVIRILGVLGVVLVIAYATLPWWLPVETLRNYFAGEMSRQMGVPVTIDRIACTWEGGLEISGLKISSPEPFGPEPMVRVEHIQADFSPLTYLIQKKLDWMEVSRPELAVRFDGQGNCNLSVLSRLPNDVTTRRISVHQAALTLRLPQDNRILTLGVADLQVISGRLQRLSRLTLSAALQQPKGGAPVSLRVQTHSSGLTAADADFSFDKVELDQFPLTHLLNPLLESQRGPGGKHLKSIRGVCSGMMSLKLNSQGIVEHLDLGLKLHLLDIQLLEGPTLPVIDEVALDVRARLDPLTDRVDIDTLHVVFPGLDLTGKASLLANSSGSLENIGLVELAGRIEPSQLLPILTGQAALDGNDLLSQGPMKVELGIHREESALRLTAAVDATAMGLARGGRTLKPAGRTLSWNFDGKLDSSDWNLVVRKEHLVLGGNDFSSRGKVLNVARRLEEFRDAPLDAARTIRRILGSLEYQSVWELRDLDSIRQAAPSLGEWMARAKIQGDLSGQVGIEQSGDTVVQLSLTAPPQTQVGIGEFHKPDGEAASVTFKGKLDRDTLALRDADLDVTVGQGLVDIDHLNVRWEGSAAAPTSGPATANPASMPASPALAIDCQWSVEQAQALLDAFPRWRDKVKVQGMIRQGTLHARVTPDILQADLAADAGQLAVLAGDTFNKPAGQKATLKATLAAGLRNDPETRCTGVSPVSRMGILPMFFDIRTGETPVRLMGKMPMLRSKDGDPQAVATLTAQTAFGELNGRGAFPLSGQFDKGPLSASAALTVTDAKVLAQTCPLVAAQFLPGRLTGAADANVTLARQDDGQLACEVAFHGGDLDFALPGEIAKSAGVPLEGRCSVAYNPRSDGADVRVRQVDLTLGDSHLSFTGGLDMQVQFPSLLMLPVPGTPAYTLSGPLAIQGNLQLRCAAGAPMFRICPPLRQLAGQLGLAGRADLNAAFQMIEPVGLVAPGKLRVSAVLLAGDLGLAHCRPVVKPAWLADLLTHDGAMVKPAGLPCTLRMDAVVAMDLSEAAVKNFAVALGSSGITADGKIQCSSDGKLDFPEAHVSLWTQDASRLAAILPGLKSYQLSGAFTSDVEIRDNGQSLPLVEFQARNLSGQLGGKKLLLDGGVRLQDLDHPGEPRRQVKSFSSDGLEIRIGENRFWVLADLKDPLAKPSGRFQLLAESLSDRDLNDYIVALAAARKPWPATAPPTAPTPAAAPHLNLAQRAELQKRAQGLIELLRNRMGDSPLKISLGVDRLKSYDANVHQTYEARHLAMDISVNRRAVEIEYHAGVNGGMVESQSHVNFNDPAPKVENQTDITDVLAGPEIQPLLANSFPGNVVHGKFTQHRRVSMPVRDSLAQMLDYRYVIRPIGAAVTVTTDGYVEGKGGPEFITRIFPGLNLTRYKYNTMTGFAQYNADGSADNDMIFDGETYNMYIEGRTDRDNQGQYEIGLVLSPGSAESMHTWKQGRFPIMKFKGRIEDAKVYDEVISYPWPNETLYRIFLQNNIIYRAWLNRQVKH
jgi:hypothetical protein